MNRIYLLRIESEETSHYLYINNISRLLNLSNNSTDKDKQVCPFCNLKFQNHKFETHIKTCYKIATEGTITKLPERRSFMKLESHKN